MSASRPQSPLPEMEAYSRHVLVCTGGFCSVERRGRPLYSQLAALLEREELLFGPTRVKRSKRPAWVSVVAAPLWWCTLKAFGTRG